MHLVQATFAGRNATHLNEAKKNFYLLIKITLTLSYPLTTTLSLLYNTMHSISHDLELANSYEEVAGAETWFGLQKLSFLYCG